MRGGSARASVPVDFGGFDFSGFQGGGHPGPQAGAGSSTWGSFKDIFSGIFSGQQQQHQQRPRGPQPGTDLEYQATIDFWSAIRGGQARIQVHRQEICPACHGAAHTGGPMPCPECNGTGQVTQMGGRMKFNIPCPRCGGTGRTTSDCPTCHGEGTVSRTETVEFRIKPGTRDGQRIRLQGKGNAGLNGGAPGDLYVIVRTGTNPVFSRVWRRYPIDCAGDDRGGVAGRKGRGADDRWTRSVEDSPGTQNGQKLRMRERGVESASHPGQRGDEIVTIEVVVPHLQRRTQPRDHARAGEAEQPGSAGGVVRESCKETGSRDLGNR